MTEGNLFDVPAKKRQKKTPAPLPGGTVQRLIGVYARLFEARFAEKPVILPRDGAALKRLIGHAGEAAVERRLPLYLALPDEYLAREGYPLVLLQSVWNKLIVAEREQSAGRTVPGVEATEAYLKSLRDPRRI